MPPADCRWLHHREEQRPASMLRNLRIARAWVEAEPENPAAGFRVQAQAQLLREAGIPAGESA